MIDQLQTIARGVAQDAGIDPVLVCAVIEQESGWVPYAIRYEPAFLTRYVPTTLPETERQARAFSWGLMQIMGQVAREEGYGGPLPMLCDPATGIRAGVAHLKRQITRANGDLTKALLYWNGGGNLQYPIQVLARRAKYEIGQ